MNADAVPPSSIAGLAAAVGHGERAVVARALTIIERGGTDADALLVALRPPGRAWRIGITGPPGAGKSTLTLQLVRALRPQGTVAVIAVDPSSPISGGALLGDRVRMNDVAGDDGVFIRSMASRGALGGLSAAVADGARLLDAAGFDFVLLETVGVGQNELDVARLADTTLVVVTPESGDEVQTAKAGLMEIADVFVLNKDDRPDGNAMWTALRRMVDARRRSLHDDGWTPPIVRTIATAGEGIVALLEAVASHRAFLDEAGRLLTRRRLRERLRLRTLVLALVEHRLDSLDARPLLDRALAAIAAAELAPHEAAAAVIDRLFHTK